MQEWEGGEELGLEVVSLYSRSRKPSPSQLEDLDLLLVDLQDVGVRYYTYVWTLKLVLEVAADVGLPVIVLDRPNPLGRDVEGPLLNENFFSFVGLSSIPVRHGMTVGELASLFREELRERGKSLSLEVIRMRNWSRAWEEELPWIPPSPNMPFLSTARVYSGGCLLEATNISEGRGTTRPFEFTGAPEVNPFTLKRIVEDWARKLGLDGFYLYPVRFVPTFDKHRNREVAGVMVIAAGNSFKPFRLYSLLIRAYKLLWEDFRWLLPPYEYEYSKMPIDILWGNSIFREFIDRGANLDEWKGLFRSIEEEEKEFLNHRERFLLY